MNKKIIGLFLISTSLQFASIVENSSLDVSSKIDIKKSNTISGIKKSKDDDNIRIDYSKIDFSLKNIKLNTSFDIYSKEKSFNDISINNLNIDSKINYETDKFYNLFSLFVENESNLRNGKNLDLNLEAGLKFYINDNFNVYQGLKYYSDKLTTPYYLTEKTILEYLNGSNYKGKTTIEFGGTIKGIEKSIIYKILNEGKYDITSNNSLEYKVNLEGGRIISKKDKNSYIFTLEFKNNNKKVYKDMYINNKFLYEYNDDSNKLELNTRLGYMLQLSNNFKIDPYAQIGYDYFTKSYNQIEQKVGMDMTYNIDSNLKLDAGIAIPFAFSFEKGNNRTNLKFAKIGGEGFVRLGYSW